MELENETFSDSANLVEFEDLDLSEVEESVNEIKFPVLSIDSNSRIATQSEPPECKGSDYCDTQFQDGAINFEAIASVSDEVVVTSDEEIEVPEEDVIYDKIVLLKHLDSEGVPCVATDSKSDTFVNFSSTNFKDECSTKEEFVLNNENESEKLIPSQLILKRRGKLTSGKTVSDRKSAAKVTSALKNSKFSSSFTELFSNHLCENESENNFSISHSHGSKPKRGLVTCLEFLKSRLEDGLTDIEEFSDDSSPENSPLNLKNALGNQDKHHKGSMSFDSKQAADKRSEFYKKAKGAAILNSLCKNDSTDSGTDDELLCVENENIQLSKKMAKKHLKNENFFGNTNDLTDEEDIDILKPKWTETDESGAIRQVTQIKTETSIKLDGEGGRRSQKNAQKEEGSVLERKLSDDSSFSEKKSFFQRLSLTSDTLPTALQDKWAQDVSLDDLPMAEGEIIKEQISFEERLKMFEPDEDSRRKFQKRDKAEEPTVYRYDFTKTKEKPDVAEFVVSELEKAEEIVKQVNKELNAEEQRLAEQEYCRNVSESEQESAFTLEKVEQEVSSLLAEVDKEEKEFSQDHKRVPCSRTDSEKSNNINSYIFDMESDKCYDTNSEYAALTPDFEKDHVGIGDAHKVLVETDVQFQDGDKFTVLEAETPAPVDETRKVEFVADDCMAIESSAVQSEGEEENVMPEQPLVESPLTSEILFEQQKFRDDAIRAEEIQICPLRDSEDLPERKFSAELYKKEEFREALKLEDSDSISDYDNKFAANQSLKPLDITSVDVHIKSEILREEIDQSIEDSPLEVKHIAEDLERMSVSEDHKCDVARQIRTEIFSQELGEDIENGSPERKELTSLSSRKTEDDFDEELQDDIFIPPGETLEGHSMSDLDKSNEIFNEREFAGSKILTPQISEDASISECLTVERDDFVEYEEAKDEHSLTEQLLALASDSIHSAKGFMSNQPLQSMDFDSDPMSSGISSNMSDLDMVRRGKEIAFSRHDKKEIRSLKSTKQVSTIEEHSSIESCDSPQDLMLQDLPEKVDSGEINDDELKTPEVHENIYETDYESHKLSYPDSDKDSSLNLPRSQSPSDDDDSKGDKFDMGGGASLIPVLQLKQSDEDSAEKIPKIPRSESKSSQGKKSDSDAEGSKHDSLTESGVRKKEESFSSSGETESPYYSVDTSDSGGKTSRSTPAASRPCSSEFEINVFSGHGSEYETCVTSQEASGEGSGSYATAVSSQEISYATACSSFSHSSRESAHSVDSESSGHLASVEASSEASETLVPSAQEMELEFGPDIEMPVLDEEPSDESSGVREPYDMKIPEAIIRSGIEMPFMRNWEMNDMSDGDMKQLPEQWTWQYATESEILDTFEVIDGTNAVRPDVAFEHEHPMPLEGRSVTRRATVGPETIYSTAETRSTTSPRHRRRSSSSLTDIVTERECSSIAIDEEQLSVSESSATHSEQTWQTMSIDTTVQLSFQGPSCLAGEARNVPSVSDSIQESPPEKELTPEQSQPATLDRQPESPYLQLNGPVEVDYNPDYDNPEGDDTELRSNQEQSSVLYEGDGLQFELEIEGSSSVIADPVNGVSASALHVMNGIDSTSEGGFEIQSLSTVPQYVHPSVELDSQVSGGILEADKPEAQQTQSFNLSRDFEDHQGSDFAIFQDQTSFLPESDQCDLISHSADSQPQSYDSRLSLSCGESSHDEPLVDSKALFIPENVSSDSIEKGDIVDTSPEDERYEYKSGSVSETLRAEADVGQDSGYTGHSYDQVPGTDLYTHHEEEELYLRNSDVYPSPVPSGEDDKQSTPSSFDAALHGKRYFFPRSGDTSAASSLQEFERLEADISAGRLSRSSIDSNEKAQDGKSGEHDNVSMCSLTEFEKLEKECTDNEQSEMKITEPDIMMLSEIEEGLESQSSDALEILLESGVESSEYERRRTEMEEIIKVAQSNVERFQEDTLSDGITSDECTTVLQRGLSDKDDAITDVEESEQFLLISEADGGHDSSSSGERHCGKGDCMISSTDSMDPSSSTATHATYQFETDSVMSSSINSAQASGEECTMISSTDTLEPENKITYTHAESSLQQELTSSQEGVISHPKEEGSFSCKIDALKELQEANGAKAQMEMFLSRLTDDTSLMSDFAAEDCPSEPFDESELLCATDVSSITIDAASGVCKPGTDFEEGDDLMSRTTATTTTRIVTTVTTDDGDEATDGQQSVLESGDDLRHSVEVILNQFMSDDPQQDPSDSQTSEKE